jgi:hypothetical protein
MLLPNFIKNFVLDKVVTEANFITQGKGYQRLLKIYEDVLYFQSKTLS